MTADAKVGLLLGLFFIVLIAFLVNGFPSFLQSATAEDVVKTTSIVAPSGPMLVIDHGVTDTAQRLSPGIPLRVVDPPQEVIVLDSGVQSPAAAAAVEAPAVPQPAPAAAIEQINVLPAPSAPAAQTASRRAGAVREHVIERGETLAGIAQKYYGSEEGNRRAVIQKLYEANSHVLSSPDKIVVGVKLTIPALDETVSAKPSVTEALLQRFSNVFERTPAVPQPAPSQSVRPQAARPAAPRTTEYVVQPGDSLWKIAEKTLGDGSKFETLLEMNKDRLKNADAVIAGMKLVIPVP